MPAQTPNGCAMRPAPCRVDAVMLEARASILTKRSFKAAAKRSALELVVACMDLTTLEGSVAAICVYPALVPVAVRALAHSSVKVASVATAFPSGLSPLDVKLRETLEAVAAGADEIDMVIDRSAFLAGHYDAVAHEIAATREACAGATLKVILEVGELGSYAAVRRACDLALAAGADFLKTSTGKIGASSTPAVALLMCEAIREHARRTGREVGLKLAGGIRTSKSALGYVSIVHETLGNAWLVPERFRIGASSLLDDVLMQREKDASGNYAGASYVAVA